MPVLGAVRLYAQRMQDGGLGFSRIEIPAFAVAQRELFQVSASRAGSSPAHKEIEAVKQKVNCEKKMYLFDSIV